MLAWNNKSCQNYTQMKGKKLADKDPDNTHTHTHTDYTWLTARDQLELCSTSTGKLHHMTNSFILYQINIMGPCESAQKFHDATVRLSSASSNTLQCKEQKSVTF